MAESENIARTRVILRKIHDLFDQDEMTADVHIDEKEQELFVCAPLGLDDAYTEFVVRVELL